MSALWKENMAARVALATAGLLALVLVVVNAAAYAATALLIRAGTDAALLAAVQAALPVDSRESRPEPALSRETPSRPAAEPHRPGDHEEADEEAERYRSIEREDRRVQVVDAAGQVLSASAAGRLPVDPAALTAALRNGHAFASVVGDSVRRGPDWWMALRPAEEERRVLFLRAGTEIRPLLLQVAVPVGPASELLPELAKWLAVLAVGAAGISGLIAWRMSSAMYRPLRAIAATAEQIDRSNLGIRMADVWSDTTLRRLVAVLNAMVARLQTAFDAQGRFVASAAHELRGPLAAMRAELEVTLRRERPPAQYREALAGALQEAERLSALAERLLLLARFERGAGLAIEHGIPVGDLVRRAAAEVARTIGGEVRVEAPPDLVIDGDPLALERAVANLVRNGLQAGGSPVTIRVTAAGSRLTIEVSDRGPGIRAEQIPLLFEPFFRGDPARSRDGGTGLGLAIVKAVADAHDGRVEVQSEPGAGSSFRMELPRKQGG